MKEGLLSEKLRAFACCLFCCRFGRDRPAGHSARLSRHEQHFPFAMKSGTRSRKVAHGWRSQQKPGNYWSSPEHPALTALVLTALIGPSPQTANLVRHRKGFMIIL